MLFLDTSAIVAYFIERDSNHRIAVEDFQGVFKSRQSLVITDYILNETITTMLARAGHRDAVKAGNYLLKSNIINIIWLDKKLKLRAWEYFKRHRDKRYSFTDCTSFVLMKDMGIRHYIAFDEHFSQAGFISFK